MTLVRRSLLSPTGAADPTEVALMVSDGLLGNALVPLLEDVWQCALPIGLGGSEAVTDEGGELLTMVSINHHAHPRHVGRGR
ncbi:hypothetical protein RPQ02_29395 [Streptomyces sp. AM2-3-1]|uniref:hypothetical protein n=1 Tax=Streptomyces sp. AM2-3-1 TaxID=3075824 RepID=UPI0028C488B2|nr:hypothetical protein [Streptomyces sp. AM2-3-1]WNO67641.1 hypothetical protein RPQ02_29395 [Streptomyces sp. AM2-3-1]